MFGALACAIIEPILNHLLTLEPQLASALKESQNKVLAIELRDWQHTFAMTYTGQQFMLFSQYHDPADCHISASLETLAASLETGQMGRTTPKAKWTSCP